MSVLDAFFSKGFFKAARCKTLLKLTIPRIKLLRNRRDMQLKQMRKDIAKLLEIGQEATARIRVEHIIREENMMAAQEIVELFCELISVRLPIIEAQRECPLDLKEAISTICFAAPRCADLPELQQVQMQFAGKYGKEFVAAASELRPDSGVNRQVIELLSIRVPPVEVKMKLLKEIAEEHEVDWDPAATEAEFLKPHADLLNGPSQYIGGSTLPLLGEKDEEQLLSAPAQVIHDETEIEADTDLDSLDLPEVPNISILPDPVTHGVTNVLDNLSNSATVCLPDAGSPNISAGPQVIPVPQFPSQSSDLHVNSRNVEGMPFYHHGTPHPEPNIAGHESLAPHLPSATAKSEEFKEVDHFIDPSFSTPIHQVVSGSTHVTDEIKQPTVSATVPLQTFMSTADWQEIVPSQVQQASRNSCSSFAVSTTDTDVDLQDVLAAAQTAAETADRAAAAARAAASLAQLKITELMMKRNGQSSVEGANEIPVNASIQVDLSQNQVGDQEHLHGYEMPSSPPKYESVAPSNPMLFSHQTMRSSSLDEDPYFYPNLFSRQNSDIKSTVVDNSQTSKE